MGFLDWIKAGSAQQPAAQTTTPVATPAPAVRSAAESLNEAQRREAAQARALMDKATQHLHGNAPPRAPAPGDCGSNNALRQMQNNQDKTQAPMSPTDDRRGRSGPSR